MSATLTLNKQDIFQLHYDAATRLLCGTWLAPVLDADLRSHYAELLEAARQIGSCYWLLDMRQRNWHMPSFSRWFSQEFGAAVQAAIGRPVFVAYVLSPRHQTAAEEIRTQLCQRESAAHDFYPYFFADESAALDWLRHQQELANIAG
jgi:hypothetical protein